MFVEIVKMLDQFFKGDAAKVAIWLETSNLNFGGSSPIKVIKQGRVNKVHLFVKHSLEGNFP